MRFTVAIREVSIMPASLDHIHQGTPMGANLVAGGATFRVWAPNARSVHVDRRF